METSQPSDQTPVQLTFFAEEPPVSLSQPVDQGEEWTTRVARYPSSLQSLLIELMRDGFSGKMSPAFSHRGGGRDFGVFLGALAERGYFFSYRILDACFFGLAQRRLRVWVVGYLGDWRPPAAVLFEPPSLRGHHQAGGSPIRPRGTVFAEGIPSNAGGECEVSTTIRSQTVSRTLTRSIGKAIQEKMETYVSHTVSDPSRLLIEGSGSFISHCTKIRKLTPLEYERLQGFPEGWTKIPKSSDSARYKVLGNAWPVNVARWIMARINTVNEVVQ